MANRQDTANTAEDNRYNGWTNYETWAVALWIDNDYGSHTYWRQEAARHVKDSPKCQMVRDGLWTTNEAARFSLADQLKEETTDAAPDMEPSVYSDLLRAAFDSVNWSEVAQNLLDDLKE